MTCLRKGSLGKQSQIKPLAGATKRGRVATATTILDTVGTTTMGGDRGMGSTRSTIEGEIQGNAEGNQEIGGKAMAIHTERGLKIDIKTPTEKREGALLLGKNNRDRRAEARKNLTPYILE